jgi:hypothetical protein
MTDIVTGTVVHWNPAAPANPPNPPVFDPNGTKQITVDLPSGSDNGVAAVAIVSRYVLDLKDEKKISDMLTHATDGLVRVLNLQRTQIPSVLAS